jgi:cysteine desulfurase
MSQPIYLDYAAATPLDSDVYKAMQPYLTTDFYNPSATYLAAKKVRQAVEDARARTAQVLGVRPGEIVFTAGATEANNLAIHGVMAKHPDKKVLVMATEHASVLEAAKQYNHQLIPVDSLGNFNLNELEAMITDEVVLISAMWVNNETGKVETLSAIAGLVSKVRTTRTLKGDFTPLYLHSDGAQAPNLIPVYPKRRGVDLLTLNGGKIYGPKQSGILYMAGGIELDPLIHGGGQEHGLRSGTENVANIVGFSYALEKAVELRPAEEKRLQSLHKLFTKELAARVPQAELTIPVQGLAASNFVHIVIPGTDNERLMMELDEAGVQCAVGSACSASDDEPSHVLKALGFSDEQAQSSLRFTMGRSTTEADIKRVAKTLAQLLA